jgi:membrane protein DedA with SNARE-associated domain
VEIVIMRQQQPRNWLMELAVKALKYFLLSLAGCTIAYVVSVALGISFVSKAAVIFLEHILARAFILVVCLVAVVVIAESLRY